MIEYENLYLANRPFADDFRGMLDSVLDSGSFILGKQAGEFEREFANFCGSIFCVGVGNGLDALTIALRSFSFKEGSEVIVPSNTHIATILAILNSQLLPVLVEPDPLTYNLDPNLVEDAITKRTVAIMVVHLYGKCCDMDDINTISRLYKLRVIEDCAHAHGAKYKGKSAGTFGDFGSYSFYPTKNLGALGDGGCLVTNEEELSRRVKLQRNYGSAIKDVHEVIGLNSRLDELQASFLRIKLKSLNNMNEHRRKLADLYSRGLDQKFIKPKVHKDYFDVYHVYNIRHKKRDELKEYLKKHGVETMIHYPVPPHQQKALRSIFSLAAYPISEEIHATTLSLPISPIHSEKEILEIIEIANKFLAVVPD